MAEALDKVRRIVFTGAAGGIGTMTRPLLGALYPGLVLSDQVKPGELAASETFLAADLAKPHEVAAVLEGAHSVIHFGGFELFLRTEIGRRLEIGQHEVWVDRRQQFPQGRSYPP